MIFTIPEVLVNFAMIKFAEDVLTKHSALLEGTFDSTAFITIYKKKPLK
jgi:hypothetical protein